MSKTALLRRISPGMSRKLVVDGLALLLGTLACTADAAPSTDVAAAALYEDVQAVLSTPDDRLAKPASETIAIYLGHEGASKGRIVEARLTVAGVDQPVLRLSPRASELLSGADARQLVARLPLADHEQPASLVVQMLASGRTAADGDLPPRSLSLAFTLPAANAVDDAARVIELTIDEAAFKAGGIQRAERQARRPTAPRPGLLDSLLTWSSGHNGASYLPGGEDDPALAHARFLRRLGTADAAEIELMRIAAGADRVAAMPQAWQLERLRCAIALGDLDRAERLIAGLQGPSGERDAGLATERLLLAERALADDDLPRVQRLLADAETTLPQGRKRELRDIRGRLMLAEARNAEAVAAFSLGSQNDEAWDYVVAAQPSVLAAAYRRFNLAVAMLRNGDEAQGLSWLDLLGRSRATDAERVALRDRANVEMGWHFLKARRGRSALGVLGRVPIDGPYSDRALLGMGWALLAPPEQGPARPALDSGPADRAGAATLPAPLKASLLRLGVLSPELNEAPDALRFASDRSPKRIEEALRTAISIWQPLAARSTETESVIEARLAIGYAHDQLGEQAQAQAAYQRVIDGLVREEQALQGNRAAVQAGALHDVADATPAVTEVIDADALRQQRDIQLFRLSLPMEAGAESLQQLLEQRARWQGLRQALSARTAPAVELARVDTATRSDSGIGLGLDGADPEGEAALAALRGRVDALLEALNSATDTRALELLDARLQHVQRHRSRALFSLARVQDDPGLGRRLSAACLRQDCP